MLRLKMLKSGLGTLFVCIVLCLPVMPAWGGTDEDITTRTNDIVASLTAVSNGITAYLAGNYDTALNVLMPIALNGYAHAQLILGLMYDNGQGVTQDYVEAVKWYQKAAEQGHAKAQYNLGLMYDKGQGVTQYYV